MPGPIATVVMPVRNEARHIKAALRAVLEQDLDPGALDVLVVDGMSEDRTRAIVQGLAEGARFPVRIVDNPGRVAAAAMNIGLAESNCAVIVRVDGHCQIPANYVWRLVETLDRTGAAAAGGVVRPVGRGPTGSVIASALRHPLAHGGAAFRTGGGAERDVDTVPFPAYRREVLRQVGGFDETMVRNQDDDLHLRLRRSGARIVLVPDLVVAYEVRPSLAALRRQYFDYGVWKVVGWRRGGRLTSARALAPALAVLVAVGSVLAGLALAAWATATGAGEIAPALGLAPGAFGLLLYFGPFIVACHVMAPPGWWADDVHRSRAIVGAIATMHVAYGLGFWWGVLRLGRPPTRPS